MKTRVLFLLAAVGLLASCAKVAEVDTVATNDNEPEVSVVKTYFSVGISPETKTSLGASEEGKRKVYWSNGDQIAVNGVSSHELDGLEENTTTITDFEVDGKLDVPYNIIYPTISAITRPIPRPISASFIRSSSKGIL